MALIQRRSPAASARSSVYNGRDGDDNVTIADTATVGTNVSAKLGGGSNTLTQNGNITGDFTVASKTADDTSRVTIAGTIGGTTTSLLGQQTDHGHGGGGCHGGDDGDESGSTGTGTTTTAAVTAPACRDYSAAATHTGSTTPAVASILRAAIRRR